MESTTGQRDLKAIQLLTRAVFTVVFRHPREFVEKWRLDARNPEHFEEPTNGTSIACHKNHKRAPILKERNAASGTRMAAIYRTIVKILAMALGNTVRALRCRRDRRERGSVMLEQSTSIRVRIDDQGYTHVTVIQWDEYGQAIVYREDENFQCSEAQF